MTVSLRDLNIAKRSLRETCRSHPEYPSATCPLCHEWALRQQERKWRQQREAANAFYLERLARESV